MTHLRPIPVLQPGEAMAARLAREPRAFRLAELVAMSSERRARTAIERGEVVRLLPDAYVSSLHADSFVARADAALLWAGANAALSGAAALFVWGLIDAPPSQIDLVVPHTDRPRGPEWVRVRRVTWNLTAGRVGSLTLVSRDLAIVLGFGTLPRDSRGRVVYRAIATRATTPDRLAATLARVPRCRSRRELLARIEAAARGAESHLEEHGARRVFNTREFGQLVRQHRVRVRGELFRIDMYDAATMTAVELDGAAYHSTPYQRQRDVRRDAILASMGILTVRLTYADITERPQWCRSVVRDVLAVRRTTDSAPQRSAIGGMRR
ncbi:hypothetical protein QQX10_05060 [Demequina sp. SYSU T00039]|uniref:DUF559 domain-containing protein n=1 Tax=Demequina lignilytica TaxID=3051663 RepID=A0AAW7M4B2_9MICO|nr:MULTISPECIES: hypothetical protein [unclassified Demequina]MDN4477365.1 hypothetical protein [Demequina sp. SYSU T00039-1]MDN4487538.1 hypothetical protein [Demequina sp. SYSU T00039]